MLLEENLEAAVLMVVMIVADILEEVLRVAVVGGV